MSQIFDIVEELEKERKKNKELEKQLKCKKEYTKYLPEDVEFVLLTRPDYDRHQEELQDKVFELQERIDKAIQTIEKNENKAPVEVILNDIGEALNILKGDNK